MTAPREPGFYWVRSLVDGTAREWQVVMTEDGLCFYTHTGRFVASSWASDPEIYEWGPRLEPPPHDARAAAFAECLRAVEDRVAYWRSTAERQAVNLRIHDPEETAVRCRSMADGIAEMRDVLSLLLAGKWPIPAGPTDVETRVWIPAVFAGGWELYEPPERCFADLEQAKAEFPGVADWEPWGDSWWRSASDRRLRIFSVHIMPPLPRP